MSTIKGLISSQSIVDNLRHGLVITDMLGKILICNPCFSNLIGSTAKKLRNIPFGTLFDNTPPVLFDELKAQLTTDGRFSPVAVNIRHADDNLIPVIISATIIEEKNHNQVCWLVEKVEYMANDSQRAVADQGINQDIRFRAALTESILNTAVDGIISITEMGKILSFNPAAERMFGYTAKEVLGKNVSILMSTTRHPNHDSYISNYLKSGKSAIIGIGRETKALHKDGSEFDIQLSISECRIDEKIVFTGIIQDISDRKNSELALIESENKFRKSFELAPQGMAIISLDCRWLKVNDSLSQSLGFKSNEMLDTNISCVVLPEDLGSFQSAINQLGAYTDNTKLECRFVNKYGDIIWFNISISLIRNIKLIPLHYVIQIVDITDYKITLHKLTESREKANNANKEKSQFLQNMSHELRTPLNAIIGYTELIEGCANLTKQQNKDLKEIKKASFLLLQLIRDILDLARIESSRMKLEMESFCLATVTNECCKMLQQDLMAKSINLVIDSHHNYTSSIVYADVLRTKQVILNILSNAVKYNKDNGSITISFQNNSSQKIRMSITDTGNGIAEDELKNLFQPFNRLGAENSNAEGTGIGLVITKNLIKKMNGDIGVYSTEGKGCTFWLEFETKPGESARNSNEDITKPIATYGRSSINPR